MFGYINDDNIRDFELQFSAVYIEWHLVPIIYFMHRDAEAQGEGVLPSPASHTYFVA